VLALGVGLLVALPAAAWAAAVPGATYTGKAADGATVTVTVSSDGALVDFYQVLGILGKNIHGATCQGTAADTKNDFWPGAPITGNSFQDLTIATFSFIGTFDGPQSASGTFNLNTPPAPGANGNPGSAGCTTGTVTWTATTASTPPGQGGGPGGGGTGGGGSGGGGGTNGGPPKHRTTVRVRVGFKRMSARTLGGTLKPASSSSSKSCTAHRAVFLWSGRRQLRRARTSAKGAFTFKVTDAMRHRSVKAMVRTVTTSSVKCASANSAAVMVKAVTASTTAKTRAKRAATPARRHRIQVTPG
jgi:hypothetical protein